MATHASWTESMTRLKAFKLIENANAGRDAAELVFSIQLNDESVLRCKMTDSSRKTHHKTPQSPRRVLYRDASPLSYDQA
jgi:hypothetical protein